MPDGRRIDSLAYYGEEAIPPEWRERLALRGTNERYADALYDLAS